MELVKTQMQVRATGHGAIETTKNIIKRTGLMGMTRGLPITICREVPAFGIYFGSYEMFVRYEYDVVTASC